MESQPQRRKVEVINVSPIDNDSDESSLAMIDSFRHLHPERKAYTYYPRTKSFGEICNRVDMILISRTLKENLRAAGMHESAQDRASSDHVPLYALLYFKDDSKGPKTRV